MKITFTRPENMKWLWLRWASQSKICRCQGWTQAKPYSVYEGVAHFPVFEGFFESAAGFKILQFFTAVSCPKDTVKTEAGIFWTGILYSLAIPYNIYDYYNFPKLAAVCCCKLQ